MAAPIVSTLNSMSETNISSNDPQFGTFLRDLVEFFRRNEVTIFAGAGVSVPSGLPNSRTLIKSISSALEMAVEKLNIGTIEDRKLVVEVVANYRLERILDSIVSFHGTPILNLILNFQSSEPNYNHKATAQLAKHGYLSHIITLNFDVFFEVSLQHEHVPFEWHLPLASVVELPKNKQTVVTITKLHGTLPFNGYSYQDYYLAATLQYAGDHPQEENIQAIKSIVKKSPVLLVCGYSNNDWDIFPILTSIPWKRVYWIQHTNDPSNSVIKWLNAYPPHVSWLVHGDVRLLFKETLNQLNITYNEPIGPNYPTKNLDFSNLVSNPAATAFSALSLLDGKKNSLYISLLKQLGNSYQVTGKKNLHHIWEKAMSWVHHAHERNPHKAIRRYRKVIPISSRVASNDLNRLSECVSMYYEHISTLKRPYLNPLLPFDIFHALRWRKELLSRIADIDSSADNNSVIIRKESERLRALMSYYVVDLYHNWAYHLLPFSNRFVQSLIKAVFNRIAFLYDRLARVYLNMDWEYRFVRRVEAHLFARNLIANQLKVKLRQVRDMFEQTDQSGHQAYTESVLAAMDIDYSAFLKVKARMTDHHGVATPSGMLRIILFQRYFWPDTISAWAVLRFFIKYSKPKT